MLRAAIVLLVSLATLAAVGALGACTKPAPASEAFDAGLRRPVWSEPDARPPGVPLDAELGDEARARPSGTVKIEDALLAFQAAGAQIRDGRQHLGAPYGARYCYGARTGTDIDVTLCEYESEDKAISGRDMSTQAFAAFSKRAVVRNHATTLAVRRGDRAEQGQNGAHVESLDDEALAKTLVVTFEGLKPKSS